MSFYLLSVNWIDFSKTLREQGIDENEPVLLRRKFFFSDGNIDSHDPVQLNLLYVQARDAVLDGTHPVTQDLACQLAGIQTHIQFGDYNPSKHKPPFLEWVFVTVIAMWEPGKGPLFPPRFPTNLHSPVHSPSESTSCISFIYNSSFISIFPYSIPINLQNGIWSSFKIRHLYS